jgi:hypothetical protein
MDAPAGQAHGKQRQGDLGHRVGDVGRPGENDQQPLVASPGHRLGFSQGRRTASSVSGAISHARSRSQFHIVQALSWL